MYELLNFPI